MVTSVIRWAIHNRALVLLASAVLAVWGTVAALRMPVDAIPDLSDVQVIVKTGYPGQSPRLVEDQITYPLTTALMGVPKATSVRGYSMFGDSYIYVLFEEGTDLYWARSRVLEALAQVSGRLPEQAHSELGPDATGVGWVYEYALVDRSGQHDLSELTSIQNWYLKYQLQIVPGVAEVATVGGMVRQYQVVLRPDAMRAYTLPLERIINAVKQANGEAGGSIVEMGEAEYMVRATGYLQSLDDLRQVVLGSRTDGTPLLLEDVAEIRLGPQLRRGMAELDGEGEVAGGIVVMRDGANAREVIAAVKKQLDQLKAGLPQGVEVVETYDRSALIQRAVDNLRHTLIEELLVVFAVCALFLFHLRSALVAVVTLPLGILTSFIFMHWQGISANIMSLAGIAIAIGAMVDAAIVMVENVHKHLERGEGGDRWQLIARACGETGPALFFSLLIITVSFLPVFALQAQEGRLFAPLAWTKTYAMAAAAGLSVTLVPVLIGYFVRGRIHNEQRNPLNRSLIAAYRPVLEGLLRYPRAVVAVALVMVVSGLWPLSQLGSEFMPELDEGDLFYMPTTLPALSPAKAVEILQQTDRLIRTVPEVAQVFGKIGRADTATDPAPLTMIETMIRLKPRDEWRSGMTLDKLKQQLNQTVRLPGVTNAWVMPIKTRIDMLSTGIKTPVGIKVTGPDLSRIQSIGQQIEQLLAPLPGTSSVYAERTAGGRYLVVDIDRLRAARYGLSIQQIQQVVQSGIGGMNITTTVEGLERYPVQLRYPADSRDSLSALADVPIITSAGMQLTLADVADIRLEDGPAMIKSENARPSGWVYVDIAGQDVGHYIGQARETLEKSLKLPAGYSLAWSGQYEYMERAKARLMQIVPVVVLLIVLLLYANFRSGPEVAITLLSLPVALVGGVWLLWALNYHLSVAVGVGFIALAGVAVETAVVMLVFLNLSASRLPENATDTQLREAVMEGAVLRVRPKLMTVATIFAGLIPIMLSSGTGAEVMRRIAAPMLGGMISATVLTLAVIPVLFYLWQRRPQG